MASRWMLIVLLILPLNTRPSICCGQASGLASPAADSTAGGPPVAQAADLLVQPVAELVLEPGQPLVVRVAAENRGSAAQPLEIRWTLQANSAFAEPPLPDPTQGYDHARGCRSSAAVDGVEQGDARLCDGDEFTSFETPWGRGYSQVVATIDLGQSRQVSGVRWLAGDANWIFKADVAVSLDGADYRPVPAAQGVDLHGKWGGPHAVAWPEPTPARYLQFRFHKDGQPTNCFRLPAAIMVFDGIDNDTPAVPQVGVTIDSGSVSRQLPAQESAELLLQGQTPIGPGGYLLGLELNLAGQKQVRWSHVFVRPAEQVDTSRSRRFGINASDIRLADEMRRCGFGWVRFENCKWRFYCTAPDGYAFDGSVGPWHVDHDKIFAEYQRLGIRVLPYVFQPPDWAVSAPDGVQKNRAGYPPRDCADYGEAIFQLVARYGRVQVDPSRLKTGDQRSGLQRIDAVELWNEPNLNDPGWGPFVGSMPQYFEVLRAGVEGARRADPSLPVTGGGLAGLDLEVVGQFAEHRYPDGKTPLDLIDVINVHFYSGREEPEICGRDPNVARDSGPSNDATYPEQLEDLVAWRDQLKPAAEIWLTETGNDVGGPIGRSERDQAGKVPRAVLMALAAGVERVMIYRESGSDPAMHAGAGLLRNDHSPRPVWFTVATLIRQLQGFTGRALRLPTDDPHVWMLLWDDGSRKLITAWRYVGSGELGLELGPAAVCDGFGRSTQLPGTAGVVLSQLPTYISLQAPTAEFERLASRAGEQARARAAQRSRLATMPVILLDFGPQDQPLGMLKGFGLPRRYTPVARDCVWEEQRGYGFLQPALSDEDARWIGDPLERDSCRADKTVVFRLRLPPGANRLRVSAEPFAAAGEIRVATPAGQQKAAVSKQQHVAEFSVAGDAPIEISVDGYFLIKWISATPEET